MKFNSPNPLVIVGLIAVPALILGLMLRSIDEMESRGSKRAAVQRSGQNAGAAPAVTLKPPPAPNDNPVFSMQPEEIASIMNGGSFLDHNTGLIGGEYFRLGISDSQAFALNQQIELELQRMIEGEKQSMSVEHVSDTERRVRLAANQREAESSLARIREKATEVLPPLLANALLLALHENMAFSPRLEERFINCRRHDSGLALTEDGVQLETQEDGNEVFSFSIPISRMISSQSGTLESVDIQHAWVLFVPDEAENSEWSAGCQKRWGHLLATLGTRNAN